MHVQLDNALHGQANQGMRWNQTREITRGCALFLAISSILQANNNEAGERTVGGVEDTLQPPLRVTTETHAGITPSIEACCRPTKAREDAEPRSRVHLVRRLGGCALWTHARYDTAEKPTNIFGHPVSVQAAPLARARSTHTLRFLALFNRCAHGPAITNPRLATHHPRWLPVGVLRVVLMLVLFSLTFGILCPRSPPVGRLLPS